METLRNIFSKPFHVTQFWGSDRYLVMQLQEGNTVGHLAKFLPSHANAGKDQAGKDWFLDVCDGDGGPSVGDFLPRILPTRKNIVLLNDACVRASEELASDLEKGGVENMVTDESLFSGTLQPYSGRGEMTIRNPDYWPDLWEVFRQDWGLELPPPDRFGMDTVTITHRPGLPCAAAMVGSVRPLIEVMLGELEFVRQSTMREGGRQFDLMEYRRGDGETIVQRYDITDVYGRADLDWRFFHF